VEREHRRIEIAGVGTRSHAFIIDWQIRALLALAWFCGAWLLLGGFDATLTWSTTGTALPSGLVKFSFAPALAIYLLYHPVLEVLLRGRTPGKRRAGVRLVNRAGDTPGWGALLIRNIFRLLDALPVCYVVGLACCLTSAQRVRVGDRVAGTLLVVDVEQADKNRAQFASMTAHSGLAPELAGLIHDLLQRWPALEPARRDELARSVLARADGTMPAARLANLTDDELSRSLRDLLDGNRQ